MSRRTKVYFSSTLEAALAQARRELGPEALLVEAGPAPTGEGAPGGYRVVCQLEETASPKEAAPPRPQPESAVPVPWQELSGRLARLENLLGALAGAVSTMDPAVEGAALQAELAAQDFPPDMAWSLVSAARGRLIAAGGSGRSSAGLRAALVEELSARIKFTGGLESSRQPAVIALVGPPGAGKTSALVKLAMQEGLARRRSVAIVTTDSHRVAASEQLRTYAAILGLPFAQAETQAMLRQALAEHASRDLVLIDTPGFSRAEADWAEEWARLLSAAPGVQTHLVLPATWRARDLLACLEFWARFEPCALLFTRLDETASCGGWATAALESGLPVSYFCTGQRIPEDLETACIHRLESALSPEPARSAAAGGRA
ncbi:MAG: AAA family ATPase [Bryobacteraceae bacterium]